MRIETLNALVEAARSSRRRTVVVEVGTLARLVGIVELARAHKWRRLRDALKELG